MDSRVAALAVIAFVALAACSDPPPRDPTQWPVTPEELGITTATVDPGLTAYDRSCIACHGADGKGNGAKTGADFTAPDGVLTKPDAQLLASILNGTQGAIGVMPPHRALLSDSDASAVLAHVRSHFGAGIAPREADAAPQAAATEPVQNAAQSAATTAP